MSGDSRVFTYKETALAYFKSRRSAIMRVVKMDPDYSPVYIVFSPASDAIDHATGIPLDGKRHPV